MHRPIQRLRPQPRVRMPAPIPSLVNSNAPRVPAGDAAVAAGAAGVVATRNVRPTLEISNRLPILIKPQEQPTPRLESRKRLMESHAVDAAEAAGAEALASRAPNRRKAGTVKGQPLPGRTRPNQLLVKPGRHRNQWRPNPSQNRFRRAPPSRSLHLHRNRLQPRTPNRQQRLLLNLNHRPSRPQRWWRQRHLSSQQRQKRLRRPVTTSL